MLDSHTSGKVYCTTHGILNYILAEAFSSSAQLESVSKLDSRGPGKKKRENPSLTSLK